MYEIEAIESCICKIKNQSFIFDKIKIEYHDYFFKIEFNFDDFSYAKIVYDYKTDQFEPSKIFLNGEKIENLNNVKLLKKNNITVFGEKESILNSSSILVYPVLDTKRNSYYSDIELNKWVNTD